MRPVNFHSPYEAAAWAVVSARRPAQQAARTRDAIARALGRDFGAQAAFPTPRRLLEVGPMPGLPDVKVERLRALARAALDGRLDQATLVALDPEEAMARVQELPGIGPFYAMLVVVRGLGHADVLVTEEPITKAAVAHFYGTDDVRSVGERWLPFRTWGSVLVHSAGRRLGLKPPSRR
jgi:DNA-3-methyladenine glycosylase II